MPGADSICGLKTDQMFAEPFSVGSTGSTWTGTRCVVCRPSQRPLHSISAPALVRPLYLSSSPCQTFVSLPQSLSDLCISAPALVKPLYLCSSPCQTLAVVSLLQPLLDLCISDQTLVRPLHLCANPCQTLTVVSLLQPVSDLCSRPCQTFVSVLQPLSDFDCIISAPAHVRPLLKPLSDLCVSAPARVRRWL